MANAMPNPLDFKSCDELDPELIESAFAPSSGSPRDHVLKLVEKMARVARPGRGAHKILEILARLAHSAWVDGALDVILRDFGLATEIDIRLDAGRHLERLRTISVAVPLSELADWASGNPEALAPLVVFDTRRDDELRLRKASSKVTQVPRSNVPLARASAPPPSLRASAAAVPAHDPPVSSARRPIAAATRRASVPPQPTAPPVPASKAPPKTQPVPTSSTAQEGTEAQATGAEGPDVHRRHTPRVVKVELPQEAYRSRPNPSERKATIRIPAVRPPTTPNKAEPDPNDEGWE
jgi:hypothetical protein